MKKRIRMTDEQIEEFESLWKEHKETFDTFFDCLVNGVECRTFKRVAIGSVIIGGISTIGYFVKTKIL